jgi:hypothetical protein
MLYQKQGIFVQTCSLFTALLLLLVACGQSPQTTSSTPVETPTAGEQKLQATVNTLQTQLAVQSTLVPATQAPAPTSVALPTANTVTEPQSYLAQLVEPDGRKYILFLSWTESNGQTTFELLSRGETLYNNVKTYFEYTLPIQGTRDGSTLNLVISDETGSRTNKFTGTIDDSDGSLKLWLEGQTQRPPIYVFHRATRQEFEKQAQILADNLPTMVPIPGVVSPAVPAATTAPTIAASETPAGTKNPIIGKWVYSMNTLDGTPEPIDGGSATLEFFSDNSVELILVHADGKVDKLKGTYTLSKDNTKLKIVGIFNAEDFTFDGTKIVQRFSVFSQIGQKEPQIREEIYTRAK